MALQGIPDLGGGTTYTPNQNAIPDVQVKSDYNFSSNQGTAPYRNSTNPSAGGGFDWGGFSNILKTIEGLSNLYFGFQQLQLGRDQFKLAKGSLNRNLSNQAQAYNTNLEDQARARLAGEGNYDPNSPQFEAALRSYVEPRRVSGRPIG